MALQAYSAKRSVGVQPPSVGKVCGELLGCVWAGAHPNVCPGGSGSGEQHLPGGLSCSAARCRVCAAGVRANVDAIQLF